MANFTEDSRTENWLKRMGVRFEYKNHIRFEELTPGWAAVNMGRPDSVPKDEEVIEKYAYAMNGGSIFPAVIIAKTASGYEVLDGTQRLSAAQLCDQSIFNAYVIKSDDPRVRSCIRICANNQTNGKCPSDEWTIKKIVDVLYEQYEFSAADCANWGNQPLVKVEQEILARDAAKWLRNLGVDLNKKPACQKGFLAAFAKVAPLQDRYKLAKELPQLVSQLQDVKANNDEAIHLLKECLDVEHKRGVDLAVQVRSKIQSVFERPEIKARMSGPRSMHPIDNVVRSMTALVTSLRSAAASDHHADQKQAKEIVALVGEIRRLSRKIIPKSMMPELTDALEGRALEGVA